MAEVVHSDTLVPAAVEFVDIAGLVKGAHKGEGLGNQFLSHIREVDAVIYVLREFSDENIVRAGSERPEDDFLTLLTELQLTDLAVLEKQHAPKANATKEEKIRWDGVLKLKDALESGRSAHTVELTEDEKLEVKSFALLTQKPFIVVLNTDEDRLDEEPESIAGYKTIRLSAKLEAQMTDMSSSDKKELLEAYGIAEPSLNKLIKTAYEALGLMTFLTAGEKEVRAWPIPIGSSAPQAAGTIHTDFEEHFIKAQVAQYEDFIALKGWRGVKEHGKVRMEGKDYIMQEGDVVEFMVNA